MEGLVLRKKTLRETVPTVAHLIHDVDAKGVNVGERHQLNASRRYRVKAWQLAATARQGQRKRLRTVSKEIAPRQNVAGVEIVVDLGDQTAEAIRRWSNQRGVVAEGAAHIFARSRRARRSVRPRNIRRRPELEYGRGYRVGRAIRLDVSRHLSGVGHTGESYRTDTLALAFVVHEEESLVLDDGAAHRAAELTVMERSSRLACQIEIITGVERVVAEILKQLSMQSVRAALGHNVDHGAGIAAVFRFEVGEHLHFVHSANRQTR